MEQVPRPSTLTTVPEPLDDLVVKMLSKDPAGRPPLAEVMAVFERTSSLDRTNVKALRTPVPMPAAEMDSAPIHIPTPTPASSPSLRAKTNAAPPAVAISLPGTSEQRDAITDFAETVRSPQRPPLQLKQKSKAIPIIILGAVFLVAVAGAYFIVSSIDTAKPQVAPPPPPVVEPKVTPRVESKVETPPPLPAVEPKAEPKPPVKEAVAPPPPPKKPKLGRLQLTIVGGSGTPKITIDGVASGPLKELSPGPHQIVVSSKGHRTQTMTVNVREGGTITKSIALEPEKEAPKPPVKDDGLMVPGSLYEKKEK
jgi:hypothetical protein